MDARKADGEMSSKPKKDKDWSFEDIARSKPYRR